MRKLLTICCAVGVLLLGSTEGYTYKASDLEKLKSTGSCPNCDLKSANLIGADLQAADLEQANLGGANLREAFLRAANLRGANLIIADLLGANLYVADLQGAYLQGANLQKALLRGANLQGADLWGADLQEADLQEANLRYAHLQDADLQDANLRGADLQGANLQRANLRGAKLDSDGLAIARASGAIGLDLAEATEKAASISPAPTSSSSGADYWKGLRAFSNGDYATALRELKPHAENGNAQAQYNLGMMYLMGKGVPQDDKEAIKWYRLAAELGHGEAIARLKIIEPKLAQQSNKKPSSPTPPQTATKTFPTKPINVRFRSSKTRPDDVAVIIGNADYKKQGKDIPNVNPAYADAEGMKRYVKQALGVVEDNIIFLKDATQKDMISTFGTGTNHKGRLFRYLVPGKSRVFVYYAGHGAPGEGDSNYLVPTDAEASLIDLNGYPIKTLYKNLSKLPAKSVTVVLEACFSGTSQGGSLIQRSSGITVVPKASAVPSNITVISAGTASQIASWEEDKSHSLFTKYFLKGMSGEADANKDSKVSWAELKGYLAKTVTRFAMRYYGREQTVQIVSGG